MSPRDLLTAAALLALSGISLAAGAQALWLGSTARRNLDHAELIAWLTQRDLEATPRPTQLRLARQFERDFAAGSDWQRDVERMSNEERTRLAENYAALSQTWFLDKVDRYFALKEPERTEYLDSQIDNIARWPLLERNKFQSGGLLRGADLGNRLPQLQARFFRLSVPERQRIQQFAGAVYLRWLARGFRQLLPLSPGEN